MMTDWDREKFGREAEALAQAALACHGDVATAMRPSFRRMREQHPDDEVRLLELWDRLTDRRML